MNQLPAVPALGLTLAIPKEQAQRHLETQIAKGADLIKERATSREMMDQLKKRAWDWTVATCNVLRECFSSEAVAMHFSSNVYFEPSLKLDDLERDADEFPHEIRGKIDRLTGWHKVLPVIPEPPRGDYIGAQFHPRIHKACWRPFELAQYGTAIANAVQEIEDVIKEFTAGNIQDTGVDLIKKAFDPETGPLLDKEATAIDNQGVTNLLTGFMERYKGLPPNSVLEIKQVARAISFASYLMYELDVRKPKQEEQPPVEFEFLKD